MELKEKFLEKHSDFENRTIVDVLEQRLFPLMIQRPPSIDDQDNSDDTISSEDEEIDDNLDTVTDDDDERDEIPFLRAGTQALDMLLDILEHPEDIPVPEDDEDEEE